MKWKIHPIVMGTKVFDKGMMTYQHDYGTPFVIPIYCWYLENASGEGPVVLVDTGEMRPVVSEDREKAIGGKIHTFAEGLAQYGLTPDKVDIIVHTHLHSDHCENDAECENAVIYVHEKELDSLHNPHPLDYRYLEDYMEDVEERGQVRAVREDTEVLPGIRMIHTPAHTEGGMSVLVETPGGPVLITGFCILEENLHPPASVTGMEMEVIPPGTNLGPKQAYDILLKARDAAPRVLCLHEPRYASMTTIE